MNTRVSTDTEIAYSISIASNHQSELPHAISVNESSFETMSSIKSVIGTLAILEAHRRDHSLREFSLPLQHDIHNSNGSGELKHQLKANPDTPLVRPLAELIDKNITESDCVATNGLIDYLGGKDNINHAIRTKLGLASMHLVTDRLQFDGVDDHKKTPYQVGATTTYDLAAYYQRIWSPDSSMYLLADEDHRWHYELHRQVEHARFFNQPNNALSDGREWRHKTGSGSDVSFDGSTPTTLYSTVVDAGELKLPHQRPLYVAAAMTVHHTGPNMPTRAQLEADFANQNLEAMALV